MIKGVLFDMDGVLVDSEAFICKAAIMMFEEIGITVHLRISNLLQEWGKTGISEEWLKNME